MAKKTKKTKKDLTEENVQASENEVESEMGEQLGLIDVGPENLEKITPHVRKLDAARTKRLNATKIEHDEQEIIKQLVHESGLKRMKDGKIIFACPAANRKVVVEPVDEKVKLQALDE